MKVALIHDWLISPVGGAENTLKEIHTLFPAPIFTLIYDQNAFKKTPFEHAEIYPSWLQKIPGTLKYFRLYLPFFPKFIESIQLNSYELIISSSHCVAKGVKTNSQQLHICYCHTPMRYAWDLMDEYLLSANFHSGVKGWLCRKILTYLQCWDKQSSKGISYFIANSQFVAERIQTHYNRKALVIYPPVDTTYFSLQIAKQNYYVTSSRLVAYKKIDLIVDAFARMPDLRLIVIGDGPEAPRLKAAPNITYLGSVSNEVLKMHLQQAKAFVFAAIEDFGIAPVEAMACGTPVIALKKGGCEETVIDRETGLFFLEQTSQSIERAVRTVESMSFDPETISQHAQKFSKERFGQEFEAAIKNFYQEHQLSTSLDSENIS